MTPGERLALTFRALEENEPFLAYGAEDFVRRKFELLRRKNDSSNNAMRKHFGAVRCGEPTAERVDWESPGREVRRRQTSPFDESKPAE